MFHSFIQHFIGDECGMPSEEYSRRRIWSRSRNWSGGQSSSGKEWGEQDRVEEEAKPGCGLNWRRAQICSHRKLDVATHVSHTTYSIYKDRQQCKGSINKLILMIKLILWTLMNRKWWLKCRHFSCSKRNFLSKLGLWYPHFPWHQLQNSCHLYAKEGHGLL